MGTLNCVRVLTGLQGSLACMFGSMRTTRARRNASQHRVIMHPSPRMLAHAQYLGRHGSICLLLLFLFPLRSPCSLAVRLHTPSRRARDQPFAVLAAAIAYRPPLVWSTGPSEGRTSAAPHVSVRPMNRDRSQADQRSVPSGSSSSYASGTVSDASLNYAPPGGQHPQPNHPSQLPTRPLSTPPVSFHGRPRQSGYSSFAEFDSQPTATQASHAQAHSAFSSWQRPNATFPQPGSSMPSHTPSPLHPGALRPLPEGIFAYGDRSQTPSGLSSPSRSPSSPLSKGQPRAADTSPPSQGLLRSSLDMKEVRSLFEGQPPLAVTQTDNEQFARSYRNISETVSRANTALMDPSSKQQRAETLHQAHQVAMSTLRALDSRRADNLIHDRRASLPTRPNTGTRPGSGSTENDEKDVRVPVFPRLEFDGPCRAESGHDGAWGAARLQLPSGDEVQKVSLRLFPAHRCPH